MYALKIEHILVIGAGTMGRGIAQWFCQQNVQTILFDINEATLETAHQTILHSWEKLKIKGKFTDQQIKNFTHCLDTKSLWTNLPRKIDLVIEAVPENEQLKLKIFRDLNHLLHQDSIIATNTSSISIDRLSAGLDQSNKSRFIGLHFFNPAPIMKLVEIITSQQSDRSLVKNLSHWFEQRGKVTAICSNRPGFIVNRVARNFYGEALRIVKTSDLNKFKEVDDVLKNVGGFKMGPFELMDLIGIDVNLDVTHTVWKDFHYHSRFAPHYIQEQLVDSGHLGKKAGKGFYEYD